MTERHVRREAQRRALADRASTYRPSTQDSDWAIVTDIRGWLSSSESSINILFRCSLGQRETMRPREQHIHRDWYVSSRSTLISYTCLRLFKLQSLTVHNLIYVSGDFAEAQTSFAVAKFLNAFSPSFTGSLRTLG